MTGDNSKSWVAPKTRWTNCVHLDLQPRTFQRLNDLKQRTDASTYAEVIRNALRLYEKWLDSVETTDLTPKLGQMAQISTPP